ncbi:uncharacterized protein LOC109074236 [Cyprinus carpio]|uniref:Uncharacterized protein LOC109074236 n=1 Tax=Cyprinus carpio TaxID=7962 RepID=A0A9Q9WK04_CYPCA|nr:uncharacterized protein LOC109074236 [Cyprinus carpio]
MFAEKAIDGNRGLQQLDTGCSSTLNQTNPWWRVDLAHIYKVSRVVVTNRNELYTNKWSRDSHRKLFGEQGNNNPICAIIPAIPAGESFGYSCGGMEGRYVNLIIPGDMKILTLCEVEVFGKGMLESKYLISKQSLVEKLLLATTELASALADRGVTNVTLSWFQTPERVIQKENAPKRNWASRGTVIQSSTSADMFAEKAIDGNRGLQQLDTGCSSTLNQTNPWWRVDLAHIYKVSRVVVTNRNDCCTEQINGAEIRIGNSLENNGNNNPICAIIPAIPAGESFSYSCGGMEGRYVNLIIPGDMKTLTLCEVEVFGKGPVLNRSIVKMMFNSRADLTELTMKEKIIMQLASALADRGFTNLTVSWFQTPERVIQKENATKS